MQKNVVRDRLVYSPLNNLWEPNPIRVGSFHLQLLKEFSDNYQDHGDWLWLHNRITGDKLMASDYEKLSKKFSVIYTGLGLKKGDCIHLVVGNHNYMYPALGGMWMIGGLGSCGDIALDDKSIAAQLKDTGARIVICIPETAAAVMTAVQTVQASSKRKLFLYSFGKVGDCEDILDKLDKTDGDEAPDPVLPDDPQKEVAIIFWTSGTTGLPKGICHTHFTAWNFPGYLTTMITPHSQAVSTTCFFHVGGFFTGIVAMEKHQTYHHMFGKGFKLSILLDTIVEVKPSTIALGTHHYVQMAESDVLQQVDPQDLESVKLLMPAGAAVPSSCEVKIRAKFKSLMGVLNVYGQTECGLVSAGFGQDNLGMITPKTKVKIEDTNTGDRCGPGKVGEICVKNPFLMLKYLNRPKESEEYMDFEGFGHTGDMGYYDKEGNLKYVDRLKELIKYQNNHISPTELEDVLQGHPGVQECLVYGKPDPKFQELISAVVVRQPGSEVTERELLEFVNQKVIDYKRIRGGIVFRGEIPRNNVGKLVRKRMREWALDQDVSKRG